MGDNEPACAVCHNAQCSIDCKEQMWEMPAGQDCASMRMPMEMKIHPCDEKCQGEQSDPEACEACHHEQCAIDCVAQRWEKTSDVMSCA